MALKLYEEARRSDWDAFVAENDAASYGHLSANFDLAGADARHSAMLYEDGALVAILPLYEVSYRRFRAIRGRALVSGLHFPAGPLFSPLTTEKRRRRLMGELVDHVRKVANAANADRIRIAYPNVIGSTPGIFSLGCLPLRDHGYIEANIVSRLLPLSEPASALLEQMRERGRRWLRKAQAAGVKVRLLDNAAEWESCYPLNERTMGELAWPAHALDIIWRRFIEAGHATALVATLDAAIVSVVVAIHMKRSAYYWIGWNGDRAAQVGANYAALWGTIIHCKARDAAWFELGSDDDGSGKARNISHFKAAFGGQRHYSLVGVIERRPVKTVVLNALDAGLSRLRRSRGGAHAGEHVDDDS